MAGDQYRRVGRVIDHGVAGERLKDRLEQSAEDAGCRLTWMAERHAPYDAPMFTGGMHRLTVAVDGLSNEAWLDDLDEHSVYLPGLVLVSLEMFPSERKGDQLIAEIEAVTVREA